MSAGRIVFLRHGRTAFNAGMRLQGCIDIPLDGVGVWQAEHGGAALARSYRADRVISSDLSRALTTAKAYATQIGVEPLVEPRLRERSFGVWEGLTRAEIQSQWPVQAAAWRSGSDPVGVEAENTASVAARVGAAIRDHAEDLTTDQTLVVVSHGAAITIALTTLLGIQTPQWRGISGLDNVHWSVVQASKPGFVPGWRLVAHNVGAGLSLDEWNSGPDWILEATSA